MARLVGNERAGLLPPRAAAPPVGVRVDDAPAYVCPRVPAADAFPAGVRLGVTVLGQILGPAAVTGQQQREPGHPGLGRRDKARELITLRLPHHRTRLSQRSIALHVPRRSDAALGSARPGITGQRSRWAASPWATPSAVDHGVTGRPSASPSTTRSTLSWKNATRSRTFGFSGIGSG